MKYLAIFHLFFFSFSVLTAQEEHSSMVEIRSILNNMQEVQHALESKAYMCDVTYKVSYGEGTQLQTLESNASYTMSDSRLVYESETYNLYRDVDQGTITVLHPNKKVIIGTPNSNEESELAKAGTLEQLQTLRDSLLKNATVMEVRSLLIGKTNYKEVVLKTSKPLEEASKIATISLVYQPEKLNYFKVVTMRYNAKNEIRSHETIYNKFKRVNLKKGTPIMAMVSSNNKPLPQYASYEFIQIKNN